MMNLFTRPTDPVDPQKQDKRRNLGNTLIGIAAWFLLSSCCILLYAWNGAYQAPGSHLSNFLAVLSNSALLGAAFASIGALLGFIFGIPRSPKVQAATQGATQPPSTPSGSSTSTAAQPDDNRFTPNTNLEEISDWLTKILVGAGLVQLAVLPQQLK